jgi:putative ABC transport system substrate-binding protein
MKRRSLILGLLAVAVAVAATCNARAEQKAQRIAIVLASYPVSKINGTSGDPLSQALFNELRRLGYVEGQNLLIEIFRRRTCRAFC